MCYNKNMEDINNLIDLIDFALSEHQTDIEMVRISVVDSKGKYHRYAIDGSGKRLISNGYIHSKEGKKYNPKEFKERLLKQRENFRAYQSRYQDSDEYRAKQKAWRKRNPNYHREYMKNRKTNSD